MLKRTDLDRLKRIVREAVYTPGQGTIVYAIEQKESYPSGKSGYDIFEEELTITKIRHPVPAYMQWSPRIRYVALDGGIQAKSADVTLTGIPNEFRSLFESHLLVEVPNEDQSSYNTCLVVSVETDELNLSFSAFLAKK